MKKKSKFQERLEAIIKKRETSPPEADPVPSQSAQMTHLSPPPGRKWVAIKDEKPPYYSHIDIWDGKELRTNWHRLSNGDSDFYANSQDNKITRLITHWAATVGSTLPKYEPMTADDIKQFTINDIKKAIEDMYKDIIPVSENEENGVTTRLAYNEGVKSCTIILKKLIRHHRMTNKKT